MRQRIIKARLVLGDPNTFPLVDNSFDGVLVAHALEHMSDPEQALAELCRVLKPGGVLIACIMRRSSAGTYIQLMRRTHQIDTGAATDWFARCGLQNIRAIPLGRSPTARHFSSGYAGRKAAISAASEASRRHDRGASGHLPSDPPRLVQSA